MMAFLKITSVLGLLLLAAVSAQAAVEYMVIDLGDPNVIYGQAWGINGDGQVAGFSNFLDGSNLAFLYSNSMKTYISGIDKRASFAYGINNQSQVVGEYAVPFEPTSHAFLFNGSTLTDLGTLGGLDSAAWGINDNGQIVGWANTADGDRHAFLSSGSTMIDLGTLGGTESKAFSINKQGQIVGYSFDNNNAMRAFLYSNSTMIDLGTLGGRASSAKDINDIGQVVGWADDTKYGRLAFLYDGSAMIDLGVLGFAGGSAAYGINNSGHVVGEATTYPFSLRAFLYRDSTMYDLNDLIDPLSGWELSCAMDINDTGQIVGCGYINGQLHGLLLTPVPEPPITVLLCFTLIWYGVMICNRIRIR